MAAALPAGLPAAEAAARLAGVSVCARIQPHQKLRTVNALKAAHVGIAMGGHGTDVAREAAAIVVLDDDFGAIPTAMRQGWRIHDNLQKAIGFIVAVHVPIAGLALLPLLAGLPMRLGPVDIALLEMIIDPVSALAFGAEDAEADVMRRPPRWPAAPLFAPGRAAWSALQGAVVPMLIAGFTLALWQADLPEMQLRSASFVAPCAGVLGLVLVNRRFGATATALVGGANRVLLMVIGFVLAILLATQSIPSLAPLLKFAPIGAGLAMAILGGALVAIAMLQGLKRLWPTPFGR